MRLKRRSFLVGVASLAATRALAAGEGSSFLLETGAVAASATLLPLTARLVFGENSYGALTGNENYALFAWLKAGCRGATSIGMGQWLGGDKVSDLHGRAAPLMAARAGCVVVMNPQNDLSDAAVTNNTAGGVTMIGRLNNVISDLSSVGVSKILVGNQPNTDGYISKSVAGAYYNANIPVAANVVTFDQRSAFDPQDATQNQGDHTHPNTRKGAKLLGDALGTLIAAQYVSAGIFDATSDLPGNLVTWNPATAWTVTNGSGLTVTQTQDTLLADGTTACRKFACTGTCTGDETLSTTVPDIKLRLTMTFKATRNTYAMAMASLFHLEITDSAGNAPQGLATLQVSNGTANGQSFSKVFTPADLTYWTEKFIGPFGVMPSLFNGQTNTVTFDIFLRGRNGVAADFVLRIAKVNHIPTEDTAYGPPVSMGAIFTTGRPVLKGLPTTTPNSGSIAVGATIAANQTFGIVGGGLTLTYDAIRDGTADTLTNVYTGGTDVGDIIPITSGSAAVPYTAVAGDSGHTVRMRINASNSFGGGSSTTAMAGAVTVT